MPRRDDDPPVALAVKAEREAKERADLIAYVRRKHDPREHQFEPKPMFTYSGRPVEDPAHKRCRAIDFAREIEKARTCFYFVTIEDMPDLNGDHNVAFAHVESTASKVIAGLGKGAAYKFGATRCPALRFLTYDPHGYFHLGYRRLIILFCGVASWAAELEKRLIATRQKTDADRCKNKNPGGENVESDGVGRFVYMAVSPRGLGCEGRDFRVMSYRMEMLAAIG